MLLLTLKVSVGKFGHFGGATSILAAKAHPKLVPRSSLSWKQWRSPIRKPWRSSWATKILKMLSHTSHFELENVETAKFAAS